MNVADILNAAADLIEPDGAWIQNHSATTAQGRLCLPAEAQAARWCASGAISRAAPDWEAQEASIAFVNRMLRAKVWNWNDRPRRKQAEVVAKLREAAAKARAGETA